MYFLLYKIETLCCLTIRTSSYNNTRPIIKAKVVYYWHNKNFLLPSFSKTVVTNLGNRPEQKMATPTTTGTTATTATPSTEATTPDKSPGKAKVGVSIFLQLFFFRKAFFSIFSLRVDGNRACVIRAKTASHTTGGSHLNSSINFKKACLHLDDFYHDYKRVLKR